MENVEPSAKDGDDGIMDILECGYTFANGLIDRPLTTRRGNLTDFQAGEVFNYLIEMRAPRGVGFNVSYLGAPFQLDERPESLPPAGTRIDVGLASLDCWRARRLRIFR